MNIKVLNEYKRKSNLTNSKIAEITGVTLSNIDKIMAGSNTNPKLDTISAICNAIGCTLDDIDDYNSEKNFSYRDKLIPPLTDHEENIIYSYRDKDKSIQMAVCKILDVNYPISEVQAKKIV